MNRTEKNGCEGCCHYDGCGYFDFMLSELHMSEEERFIEHCCWCVCGDGAECNRANLTGCSNWEEEP